MTAQTTLVRVEMRDLETEEPLLFAGIVFHSETDSTFIGTEMDFDGRANISLPPGSYRMSTRYGCFVEITDFPIVVPRRDTFVLNIQLALLGCPDINSTHYWPPVYEPDALTQGRTFSSWDIRPLGGAYAPRRKKKPSSEVPEPVFSVNGKRFLQERDGKVVPMEE